MAKKRQKIIIVAVGTDNPVKVKAAQQAFRAAFGIVKIIRVLVESGVRDQPRSTRESLVGAINRARQAQRKASSDFGVGIEGAVFQEAGHYFVGARVAVVDRAGRVGLAMSPALMLPPVVVSKIKKGRELGPIMDELLGIKDSKKKFGSIGKLTGGLVLRHQSYAMTIKVALARFISPEIYEK